MPQFPCQQLCKLHHYILLQKHQQQQHQQHQHEEIDLVASVVALALVDVEGDFDSEFTPQVRHQAFEALEVCVGRCL